MSSGTIPGFLIDKDGSLMYGSRLCVPAVDELRKQIMEEAHYTPYTVHSGGTKMYRDLRENFWWNGMKSDIAEFVSRCLTC